MRQTSLGLCSTICIAAIVGALATSCASVSKNDIAAVGSEAAENYELPEEELWAIEQSDKLHNSLDSRGLVYRDGYYTQYLAELKGTLLQHHPSLSDSTHFYFLKAPQANAFATPNGSIYVQAGLFAVAKTEGQLAAVLAHEAAHIQQRHSVKAIVDQKNAMVGANFVNILSGGLDLGISHLVAYSSVMAFSRTQEREADKIAIDILTRSGFDPSDLVTTFKNMSQQPGSEHNKQTIYSSHPAFDERIAELEQMVAQQANANAAKPGVPTRGNSGFQTMRQQMLNDALRGLIRHRRYLTAEKIMEKNADVFTNDAKANFLRGEIALGIASYPETAAIEDYWLETGREKKSKAPVEQYETAVKTNLERAGSYYRAALSSPAPVYRAHKRLADVALASDDKDQAIDHLRNYLEHSTNAVDRRSVQRKILRLSRQKTREPSS